MRNTKNIYLKRGQSKKDLEIKKYKRRIRALIILLIIVGAVVLIQVIQNIFQNIGTSTQSVVVRGYINETILNNTNGTSIKCPEPSITSTLLKGIEGFMDHLFSYPGGFWTKFFIFLGIVYLIQVIFSLVFDVVELILLIFVAIKRLIVWIYKKITGRSKQDEQLKKITEM